MRSTRLYLATKDSKKLTECLQHLVTLVENKVFDVLEVEASVPSESEDSSWSTNDDMWTILLQGVLILFNRHAAKKHPAKRCLTDNSFLLSVYSPILV